MIKPGIVFVLFFVFFLEKAFQKLEIKEKMCDSVMERRINFGE